MVTASHPNRQQLPPRRGSASRQPPPPAPDGRKTRSAPPTAEHCRRFAPRRVLHGRGVQPPARRGTAPPGKTVPARAVGARRERLTRALSTLPIRSALSAHPPPHAPASNPRCTRRTRRTAWTAAIVLPNPDTPRSVALRIRPEQSAETHPRIASCRPRSLQPRPPPPPTACVRRTPLPAAATARCEYSRRLPAEPASEHESRGAGGVNAGSPPNPHPDRANRGEPPPEAGGDTGDYAPALSGSTSNRPSSATDS